MDTDRESRKIWKRPGILVPCVVLLLILSVLSLLRLGNPQWHKHVYMFQAYVSPGIGFVDPSNEYTGNWTTWTRQGNRDVSYVYVNGKILADTVWNSEGHVICHEVWTETLYMSWWENGVIWTVAHLKNGKPHGTREEWRKDGSRSYTATFDNGKRHGPYRDWNPDGTRRLLSNHRNGKLHGEKIVWDKQDKVILHEVYETGELVKEIVSFRGAKNAEQVDER